LKDLGERRKTAWLESFTEKDHEKTKRNAGRTNTPMVRKG